MRKVLEGQQREKISLGAKSVENCEETAKKERERKREKERERERERGGETKSDKKTCPLARYGELVDFFPY